MKLINITKSLILEASARDVLVNKLKLSDKAADFFVDKCGKLSILIVNKIITSNLKYILNVETAPTKDELDKSITLVNLSYRTYNEDLTSIMDWIRVALNGDLGTHKNDDYQTLFNESKKWHDELEVGDGIYNYEENEDNIILDFRDENGMGFYWIDLLTSQCTYENKRMGHCASTGGDTLYSLRETRRINEKFTINESHLTAAIKEENDGFKIIQLKGKKNSKPAGKYHKYIVELIISPTVNIIGFGSEYDSANDFKLSDLNDDLSNVVLKNNKKVFGTIALYSAYKKGLIDEAPQVVFDIFIKRDEMNEYIDSSEYDYTKNSKNGTRVSVNFVENFLENGLGYYDNEYSWEDFTYYTSSELDNKIENYLINNFQDEINDLNLENDDDDYFNDLKLVDKIEELELVANDLIDVIGQSIDRAYQDANYKSVFDDIEKALSDYGQVLQLDYEGALIGINLLDFQHAIDSSEVLSTPEEVKEMLYKLVYEEETIDKPELNLNENNMYIKNDDFESNFYELCSKNNLPINK